MKKNCLILIISILNLNFGFAQNEMEIDSLLNRIAEAENSKAISKTEQAKYIMSFGENSLPILSDFFTDSTSTKVYSECQERKLTKGELAIIIADRIQTMPYFRITGVQNCLLTYCDNNANWIEYYLWAIQREGVEKFRDKYRDWLVWTKLSDRERKKNQRKNHREIRIQQRIIQKTIQNNSR